MSSSPTATACSARRSRPRTPCRRRFIRAWRGSTGSRAASALRSWLYRIATNVCLDMLERTRAPRAADGHRPVARRRSSRTAARSPRSPGSSRSRTIVRPRGPGRRRGPEGDGPPRLRRRAAAAPAAPARRPHPARGPALEGERGRRAARDERRLGQQRAPARSRDARRARTTAPDALDEPTASSSPATSRPSRATTSTRSPRSSTRTRPSRCRRSPCG